MSKKHINENDLDKLLKQVFLQGPDSADAEQEAEIVFGGEYNAPVNPSKEAQLISKLQGPQKNFGGYTLFLSVFIIVLLACVLIGAIKNEDQPEHKKGMSRTEREMEGKRTGPEKLNDLASVRSIKVRKAPDTFAHMHRHEEGLPVDTSMPAPAEIEIKENKIEETGLPVLTEQDRLRFANVKKQMLGKLYNLDEKLYAHVIADKMKYAGQTFITEAYHMKTTGVTNLEYKVFLADLLGQNRKDDFLKAQVWSKNWVEVYCFDLAQNYFQSDKYNDFPVVNISLDGANLFCEWLEKELWTFMRQNKLKIKPIKVRLPFDYEWIYAARNGYTKIGFAEGYNTIFDLKEGLMDESALGRMRLIRKRVKRSDSLYAYLAINHYGWEEKKLNELFERAWKIQSASPADTIFPERMKTYSKMAHVPEMIIGKRSGKIWLVGTSWKTKDDYLKLENEFKLRGSSSFVGFRPVVMNGNDPVYLNPFP